MTEENKTDEVLKWKCPLCGKELKSLYKKQFEWLVEQHKLKHKKENEVE